jgi:hypothetical protein
MIIKQKEIVDDDAGLFTDFSYKGVEDQFYANLKSLFERDKENVKFLKQRILFGTDFLINLLHISSYNEYLEKFIRCGIDTNDKISMMIDNPELFLFEECEDFS